MPEIIKITKERKELWEMLYRVWDVQRDMTRLENLILDKLQVEDQKGRVKKT